MSKNTLTSILPFVLPHCDLETLIALSSTSKSAKNAVLSVDQTLVKNTVLSRVPWMSFDGEKCLQKAEKVTWLKCARRVAARKAQMVSKDSFFAIDMNLETISKTWGMEYSTIETANVTESLPNLYKPFYKVESETEYEDTDLFKWKVSLRPPTIPKRDYKEDGVQVDDGTVKEYRIFGSVRLLTVERDDQTKTFISTSNKFNFDTPLPDGSHVSFIPNSTYCLAWFKHATSYWLVLMDAESYGDSKSATLVADIPVKTFKKVENPYFSATFYDGILYAGLDTLVIPIWVDLSLTREVQKLPKNFPVTLTQLSTAIHRDWRMMGFQIGRFKTSPYGKHFLNNYNDDYEVPAPMTYVMGVKRQFFAFERYKHSMFMDLHTQETYISLGQPSAPIMGLYNDEEPLQYRIHNCRSMTFSTEVQRELKENGLTVDSPVDLSMYMHKDWRNNYDGQERGWKLQMFYYHRAAPFKLKKEYEQTSKHDRDTGELLMKDPKKRKLFD